MKIKVKLLIEGQYFQVPPDIFTEDIHWMRSLNYELCVSQAIRGDWVANYLPSRFELGSLMVVKPKGISESYSRNSKYLLALPGDTLVDLEITTRPYPPRNPVWALNPAPTRATATAVGTARASATAPVTPPTETTGHNRVVYWHPNNEVTQAVNYSNEQSQSLQREVARLRANYALHGDTRSLASIPASWFESPVSVPPEQPSSLSDSCRRAEAMVAELEARMADLEQPNVRVMPSGWRIEQVVPQRPTPDQERSVQQLWAERNSQLNAAQWAAHRSPSPGGE